MIPESASSQAVRSRRSPTVQGTRGTGMAKRKGDGYIAVRIPAKVLASNPRAARALKRLLRLLSEGR
jgi:hypothetical protein